MQRSTTSNILASLLIFITATLTQAAVLSSPTSNSTITAASTTTTTTTSPSSTTTPIVIAGNCDQNTLQYCCPLILPTPDENSVEFAGACMQGNLPASYDCFFAFESICCQGTPDANGNTCEIVPPAGDICAPGAAGMIEAPGVAGGASTVGRSVDCASMGVVASYMLG